MPYHEDESPIYVFLYYAAGCATAGMIKRILYSDWLAERVRLVCPVSHSVVIVRSRNAPFQDWRWRSFTWQGKNGCVEDLGLSFPLCPTRRDFVLKPYYNKSFIKQAYSFKMAEYLEGSFLYSVLLLTLIQLYKGKLDKKREREIAFLK